MRAMAAGDAMRASIAARSSMENSEKSYVSNSSWLDGDMVRRVVGGSCTRHGVDKRASEWTGVQRARRGLDATHVVNFTQEST